MTTKMVNSVLISAWASWSLGTTMTETWNLLSIHSPSHKVLVLGSLSTEKKILSEKRFSGRARGEKEV